MPRLDRALAHVDFADLDRAGAVGDWVGTGNHERNVGGACARPDLEHHRQVYRCAGEMWVFECDCGYFSLPMLRQSEAETRPCEKQRLDLESAERRQRYFLR